MVRGIRVFWISCLVFFISCAAICGRLEFVRPAHAQFGDERRRGDLSPINLPGGSVVEFRTFQSEALGTSQPYSIFLPPSYARETTRKYPVVFFLHGLNNDHTSWTVDRYGNLQNKVEEMILAKKVPEFIMVHPKADNGFYCNYADGSKRYEDLITKDVVSYVEATYRVKSGKANRAIGGTSMGGYGALKIAMKFPGEYASVVAHSPIIFAGKNPLDVPEEMKSSRYYQFFVGILRPLFGEPLRQELWDENNPLVLAKSGKLDGLHVWFDYGTDDRYIQSIHIDQGIKELDQELTAAGVKHTFKIYPGEPHGWALVAAHIEDTLSFLCQSF
jgi:S-formylglutathione hydrolase FrmB